MAMDVVQIAAAAAKACDNLGEVELAGIKLESCDTELLNILSSKFTLDQHVAMQPSAIAFYGQMKKLSSRRLAAFEREWDRWEKKKMAEARTVCEALSKKEAKLESVKGRFIVDNEIEITRYETRFKQFAEQADTLDAWFEAWKAKGFAIKEHASIEETENYQSSSFRGNNGDQKINGQNGRNLTKSQTIRDIIEKRREQVSSQG